jgi:hypothetical protein
MSRRNEAGGAKSALQGMMFAKTSLQRRQFVTRQPFDRHDFFAARLNGQDQARPHGITVDENSARPADAMFASQMRACLLQIVANAVCQRGTCLYFRGDGSSIEFKFNLHPKPRFL